MIVDVAPLPGCVSEAARKIVVMVDLLRASTTITTLLEVGVDEIIVAANPEDAFAIAGPDRERYVICGEVGGRTPPGFDHGNSPTELSSVDLKGRKVILTTSNGARALAAVADARLVLVAAGRNATAVASEALTSAERLASDLSVVCAGDDHCTLLSLEDFFLAGYLVELMLRQRTFVWPVDESNPYSGDPTRWILDESALAALRLYRSYLPPGQHVDPSPETVLATFNEARNGHTLPRLGFSADLEFCARVNCSTVVPRLSHRDGRVVVAES